MAAMGSLLFAGCVFDGERRATSDVVAQVASAYVFRGQVMTDRPVAQGALAVNLPSRTGGTTSFRAFGNLDLVDDTGRAWFDEGHGGEFTEIDLSVTQTERVGGLDLSLGLLHYTWPNGEQFPFGGFPSTAELTGRVGGELLGLRPALTVHYDIDEVESLYVRADIGHGIEIGRSLRLDLLAWLAWSDADHSSWLYLTDSAGLADAGLAATLSYALDVVTTVELAVAGSTIVDDTLREWFRSRVDADNVWLTLGIAWRF